MLTFFFKLYILLISSKSIQAKWLQTSVSRVLSVSPETAYNLYLDLTQQPTWSPWITSVNVLDKESGLSKWTMSKFGLSYSWSARNVDCNNTGTNLGKDKFSVCWESIDGVPNKGHASFYIDDEDKSSKMTLIIEYKLPGPLAFIIESLGSISDRIVENTLLKDLGRFNDRLIKENESVSPACDNLEV